MKHGNGVAADPSVAPGRGFLLSTTLLVPQWWAPNNPTRCRCSPCSPVAGGEGEWRAHGGLVEHTQNALMDRPAHAASTENHAGDGDGEAPRSCWEQSKRSVLLPLAFAFKPSRPQHHCH